MEEGLERKKLRTRNLADSVINIFITERSYNFMYFKIAQIGDISLLAASYLVKCRLSFFRGF